MSTNDYLFPRRMTRRDFLTSAAVTTAMLAVPDWSSAQETKTPVRLGNGYYTYELVEDWGTLPAGLKYGFGCGIVVDGRDHIPLGERVRGRIRS
jgi:hypothetical protein